MNSLVDMISYYDANKKGRKTHVNTHLRVIRLLQTNEFSYTVRSQRKIDNKTITRKNRNQSISFSKRMQCDIYGLIHPPCGSFHGFD